MPENFLSGCVLRPLRATLAGIAFTALAGAPLAAPAPAPEPDSPALEPRGAVRELAYPALEADCPALEPVILPLRAEDVRTLLDRAGVTWLPDDRGPDAPAWQSTPTGRVLALHAWCDGAPILDAAARLHEDRAGRLTWLVCPRGLGVSAARPATPSSCATELSACNDAPWLALPSRPGWTFGEAAVRTVAAVILGGAAPGPEDPGAGAFGGATLGSGIPGPAASPPCSVRIERAWLLESGGLRDVYLATPATPVPAADPATGPPADPAAERLLVLDGTDGRLLAERPLALRLSPASGEGYVFDPNPVVTSGNRDLTSADDVDPWRVTATLTDLDGSGMLRGAWVNVENPAGRAFHPELRFFYSARDLHFEEVMAYYHITRAQQRLQALGFTALDARPQSVTVHATGLDESWFSPTDRRIYLGDGGVDDAEDADVILHEYGHALHHAAVGALGCADARSLSEGFADYLAASFTGDACVGDWDGTYRPGGCLRDLTEVRRYPEDRTGDPHEDGLLWSGTLWRLRELLGPDVADRLAACSLYYQLPRSRFQDAAGGLVAAAVDLERALDRSDIRAVVEDVLGERGFLARRGTFSLSAGGPERARIPLGFPFRGPGAAESAWSDTLTVYADGRCVLGPLSGATDDPAAPVPVLAPLVTQCDGQTRPCEHEQLRVSWTAERGALATDLRFMAGGVPVRRVIVTLGEDGRIVLEWSGEGQQASVPGLTGWFPQGLAGTALWLDIPGWSEGVLDPGEGFGMHLPDGPFPLAGARLVLEPSAAGGYTARLEAAALPADPELDHAVTVWPTPARPGSRVVFRTLAGGPCELALLDASGRLLARHALGHLDPGLHAIDLNDLAPDRGVAAGVHFIRLQSDVDTRIAKVVYLP
jgi:hypothetical protein